jgi:hypothetical protein
MNRRKLSGFLVLSYKTAKYRLRYWKEVVKRKNAGDDGSQGCGNLRIAIIRGVLNTVYEVTMDLDVKSLLHLSRSTGKLDKSMAVIKVSHTKA